MKKKNFKEEIEPQDIFLDAKKEKEEEITEGRLELLIETKNFIVFYILIILVFSFFILRISQINILQGEELEIRSRDNGTKIFSILAPRGVIYDKNLKPLATTGQEPAQKNQREYFNGPAFFHLLGFMGRISQDEREKYLNYPWEEKIGKSGIEFQYQETLRGKNGQEVYQQDALGKIQKKIIQEFPQPGADLVLTVDAALQQKIFEALTLQLKNISKKRAAAVALNPQNGDILALLSAPSIDSNLLSQGINEKEYQEILGDPNFPFLNRAIAGQYPPGSTIKPIIAAAGLQEKIITANTKINDSEGKITLPNPYNPSLNYVFRDWKIHGLVDVKKAIAESCNVFFYYLGGGYQNFNGLGVEKLLKYFKSFKLGEKTDIDLPQEAQGFLPSPLWKKEKTNTDWYIGDTYNLSIGQGDLLLTPLQLARAIAALTNEGTLYKPKIIDKIIQKNQTKIIEPQIAEKLPLESDNLKIVLEGMRQTVQSGSARGLSDLNIEMGAKTGTAQNVFGSPHAWIAVFAPFDKPQILLVILIENGGEGSSAALPVAKDVLKWYFNR